MMSDMHTFALASDGVDKNMSAMTQTFNREVIEKTIENLRHRFNERGLSEDILERLKANWTKSLSLRMHTNKEAALQRQYELLEN
jgi:predicted DNA-binding protein